MVALAVLQSVRAKRLSWKRAGDGVETDAWGLDPPGTGKWALVEPMQKKNNQFDRIEYVNVYAYVNVYVCVCVCVYAYVYVYVYVNVNVCI